MLGLLLVEIYALGFETSGSTRMTIESGGHIGIGTTNPDRFLHVAGGANTAPFKIDGSGNCTAVIKTTGTTGETSLSFGDSGADGQAKIIYQHNGDRMILMTSNGSGHLTIASDGKVAIGAPYIEPSHGFHFRQAGTADADGMAFQNTAADHYMRLKLDSSNNFVLSNAGNGGLTIDTVGKIRTTSAIFMGDTANANNTKGLTINLGSSDNHYLTFKGDISSGMTTLPSRSDVEVDDMVVFEAEANSTNGGLRISTVTDGGSVGFSLHTFTDSNPGTGKNTGTGGTMMFVAHRKSSNANTETTWAADSNIFIIRVEDDTTDAVRYIFDIDGSAHADVEWTTYSDGRLKFDQEVLPYGLNEVMQLQPKVYNRDSGYLSEDGTPVLEGKRRRQIGFVAQEVMEIVPELVKPIDITQSWYSLDDGKLSALLVSAVQQLNDKHEARLNELQAEIHILKGN